VDLDQLAGAAEGLVGSEIEGICRRAAMLAIREFIDGHPADVPSAEVAALKIAAKHFERAMEQPGKGGG
jgi:transitional endoplasmic reticulum ATPase